MLNLSHLYGGVVLFNNCGLKFFFLKQIIDINTNGVFPVPPIKIFPTQIIGILNLCSVINFDLTKLNTMVIKESGSKQTDKKFILFQNLGF